MIIQFSTMLMSPSVDYIVLEFFFLDDYHLQERWEVHYNVLHVEN